MTTPIPQQGAQYPSRMRQETPEYREMIERDRVLNVKGVQAFTPNPTRPPQQQQPVAPPPSVVERPKIDLTSMAFAVPQVVEFIRIAKLANRSRNRPDDVENTTQACLALFHILATTPLENYDKLDLSAELSTASDQITKANKALLALREWNKSLKMESAQIRQFIENDVVDLTNKVSEIVNDIENQKSSVLDKYKEAMAQIVNCTEDLATDSELMSQENADASKVFSWSNTPQVWVEPASLPKPEDPVDASVNKPKWITYEREEFGEKKEMTQEELAEYESKNQKPQLSNAAFDLPKNVGVQRTDLSTMFKGPTDQDLERLKVVNAEAKEKDSTVLVEQAGRDEPAWLNAINTVPGKDPYDSAMGFHKEDITITTIDPNVRPVPVELKITPEKKDEPVVITPVPPAPPAANLKPRRKRR